MLFPARGDCCGMASDLAPSLLDETGVDGAFTSDSFVFGAKDTLLLPGETAASWSLRDRGSGDTGCSEAFGERVSDSKDAAFRTSSSFFESLSFLSTTTSRDSLGGVDAPPGLKLASEASAKAEASSVGSTFFLSNEVE